MADVHSPHDGGRLPQRLLSVHAGWGMRIAFVPEEFITRVPIVKVLERKRLK